MTIYESENAKQERAEEDATRDDLMRYASQFEQHMVPTSDLAVIAFIFSLLGFCAPPLSVIAIVMAHYANRETATGERGGHGLVTAATLLGYIVTIPFLLVVAMICISLITPERYGF